MKLLFAFGNSKTILVQLLSLFILRTKIKPIIFFLGFVYTFILVSLSNILHTVRLLFCFWIFCFSADSITLVCSYDCSGFLPAPPSLVLWTLKTSQMYSTITAKNTVTSKSIQEAAWNSTCRFLGVSLALEEHAVWILWLWKEIILYAVILSQLSGLPCNPFLLHTVKFS